MGVDTSHPWNYLQDLHYTLLERTVYLSEINTSILFWVKKTNSLSKCFNWRLNSKLLTSKLNTKIQRGSSSFLAILYGNLPWPQNKITHKLHHFSPRGTTLPFESLFYKTNTVLQKTTASTGLREEQIFSVYI